MLPPVPKPFIYFAVTLAAVLLIPPALIARQRTVNSDNRRIHLIQDMDNQAKFKPQKVNPLFRDNRAARQPVDGAVARGQERLDDHMHLGWVNLDWVDSFPPELGEIDLAFIERGQERFNIYCTACHGYAGFGDGTVQKRAMELVLHPSATVSYGTQWTQVRSLHDPAVRVQPLGQIYNTITNGLNTMAGYGAQISVRDRWAIVAYIKALQRSQHARPTDVPQGRVDALELIDLREAMEEEQQ